MAAADCTVPVKVRHTHHLELGDNAFWLCIWTMGAATFLAMIYILAWHAQRQDEILAKTPAPLELACATSAPSRTHPACLALAKQDRH